MIRRGDLRPFIFVSWVPVTGTFRKGCPCAEHQKDKDVMRELEQAFNVTGVVV